jgi:thiol:disulfide interchange protein DsbC
MQRSLELIASAAALVSTSTGAAAQPVDLSTNAQLAEAAQQAQRQLRQTFTNLRFEDFGPAPVKGPL